VPPLRADVELAPTEKNFGTGLLVDLARAVGAARTGAHVAFTTRDAVDDDLARWSRFTGNAVVGATREGEGWRYVVRIGSAPAEGDARPIGSRLWLYTNLDCNLACDYCCVRSSPSAPRKPLGLDRVGRIASEAKELGVGELLVTGGEPFLLEDIGAILLACAEAAPTTVLTNGMLFAGRRREVLAALPRERVVLQVSLDSPDPGLHDLHRGEGAWVKAVRGIAVARELGFRVRIAATVASEEDERALDAYFERESIAAKDRLVRRIALRGFASEGIALARGDLQPEPTITAEGVYWHPVGATDDDFFVMSEPLPLARALEAVRMAWEEERRFATTLASVFHCA
jgi:sulfatase maturation enzyme AslB (radical SAM superfamily)